jgi:hypothetical protein
MMRWRERQRIFEPAGQAAWIGTHAALPVVRAHPDRHRVYFSSRDGRGRSHIGFVDVSLDHPKDVMDISPAALLSPGALGTFDDAGVTTSCLVGHDDQLFLYYTGWALGSSVPFYLNVGVAVSDDDGKTFRKLSQAPLLDRHEVDPYLTASPWVLIDNGMWRMWYVSGTAWSETADGPRHRYHIKYAESVDGRHWKREGRIAIDYASPDEYAFGRPCVVRDGDRYRMWYSYRGDRYRIGYAESRDGIAWTRMDAENVLNVSADGEWDSEMVTYPIVFEHRGRWQMLYNGNDYGRTGIGLATAD